MGMERPIALSPRLLRLLLPQKTSSCSHQTSSVSIALCPLPFAPRVSLRPKTTSSQLANQTPGYVRIFLAIGSLYYMPLHPRTCTLLYSISCLLDALDGYAARYYEQSTRFGAVLDMVTDRCTTSCLLVFLSSAFPRWAIIFQGLISLDFASHYIHMYTTLVMGGAEQSHKDIDKNRSWILSLYYTNRVRCLCRDGKFKRPSADISSTDVPLHLLPVQRALLHRSLPSLVLLAHAFPWPPADSHRG